MAQRHRQLTRLPNAPLAEVVFELRWKIQGPADAPPVVRIDPGLLPLLENFSVAMKKADFGAYKELSAPGQTGGYGVARRFFKTPDSAFPIMQIGPGIFATNESSLYEWKGFKSQITVGVRALLDSYPKLGVFPLDPNMLELR